MLETIREYAVERLLESGRANPLSGRAHAAYSLVSSERKEIRS